MSEMTDELRAATERLNNCRDMRIPWEHPQYARTDGQSPMGKWQYDLWNFYKLITAEHPEDDDGDKPWDSDWLLSIGGTRDDCWINVECENCTLAFYRKLVGLVK